MKRLLLFLLTVAGLQGFAQQKPVYEHTRVDQVLSNRATQEKYALIIPGGSTPAFPSYVPDSLKTKALWMKPDGLYRYNGTAWVLIGADPDLSNYLMLTGATNQSIAGNVRATGTLRSETGGLYSQLNGSKIESGNSNSTDYAAGTGYNDVLTQTGTGNKIRFKNGSYEFYFDGNIFYRASDGKKALFEGDISANTASNGLSKVGDDIQLGGTLTSGTTVYIRPYYLQLNAYSSTFTIDENSIISGLLHNSGGGDVTASKIAMYGDYTEMYVEDLGTGGHSSLKLDNTGKIVFKDTYNSKGVVYDDNYRGNFTALSLVDKGYADSLAAVKESLSNKQTTLDNSTTHYPSTSAVKAVTDAETSRATAAEATKATLTQQNTNTSNIATNTANIATNASNITSNGTSIAILQTSKLTSKVVATYAAMVADGTPTAGSIQYRVLVDENKGINNTIYLWYASDGKRVWVAANDDN